MASCESCGRDWRIWGSRCGPICDSSRAAIRFGVKSRKRSRLRRELPLQPRELRRTLIDQPKAHLKQGRMGPAPLARPAAAPRWHNPRHRTGGGGGEPAGAGVVATVAGGSYPPLATSGGHGAGGAATGAAVGRQRRDQRPSRPGLARPPATQRPGVRRRQPARCRSR